MQQFAGNMLQVQNEDGKKFFGDERNGLQFFNSRANFSYQKKYNEIIYSNLETIEINGGGSARCMLAEVFLPKK